MPPLAELQVSYIYKGQGKNFFVLGTDRKVVAPSFPLDVLRLMLCILVVLVVLSLVGAGIGFSVYYFLK